MAEPDLFSTIVSTKGQVILPKSLRDRRHWGPGTRLHVVEIAEGVLLKPERTGRVRVDDLFGALPYAGPPISVAEMDEGVLREARRRYLAGEY